MIRLVIIADDFTGAMDTGVQFVKQGVETIVTSRPDIDPYKFSGAAVLSINTNSRHDTPETARLKVKRIIEKLNECEVEYLYKKTDSALRGNVGSELEAVIEGMKVNQLPFIPAYPVNNRITVEGCQYVDGLPVHLSKAGQDLFTPVNSSYIADVIHKQSRIPVTHTSFWRNQSHKKGICVYNASSNEELFRIGQTLKKRNQISVTAGCAGFAEYLPEILELEKSHIRTKVRRGNVLIVSGSVNERSINQVEYMCRKGIRTVTLADMQQADWSEIQGEAERGMQEKGIFIVESVKDIRQVDQNTERILDNRTAVLNQIAGIVKKVMHYVPVQTLFVTGGDTLQEIMDELNIDGILPHCELVPGIVFGNVSGSSLQIISKSGGFGEVDVMEEALAKMDQLGWQSDITYRREGDKSVYL